MLKMPLRDLKLIGRKLPLFLQLQEFHLKKLKVFSNSEKVIRIMPTTSAEFGKSITAIFMAEEQKKQTKKLIPLLNKMGSTIELSSEKDLHEFTAVVGSGQAFIMEALKQYDESF